VKVRFVRNVFPPQTTKGDKKRVRVSRPQATTTPKTGLTILDIVLSLVVVAVLVSTSVVVYSIVVERSRDRLAEQSIRAVLREAQALAAFTKSDLTLEHIENAFNDLVISATYPSGPSAATSQWVVLDATPPVTPATQKQAGTENGVSYAVASIDSAGFASIAAVFNDRCAQTIGDATTTYASWVTRDWQDNCGSYTLLEGPKDTQNDPRPPQIITPTVTHSIIDDTIHLDWSAASGEKFDGYKILRDNIEVASLSPETYQWFDNNTEAAKTYTYQVVAHGPTMTLPSELVTAATPFNTIFDDFNRTAPTLGTTSTGSLPWQVLNGSWATNGQNANGGDTNTNPAAVVQTWIENVTLSAEVAPGDALIVRAENKNNYVQARTQTTTTPIVTYSPWSAWSAWSNIASCVAEAQGATNTTARQCQQVYVPSGYWTGWSQTSSCTPIAGYRECNSYYTIVGYNVGAWISQGTGPGMSNHCTDFSKVGETDFVGPYATQRRQYAYMTAAQAAQVGRPMNYCATIGYPNHSFVYFTQRDNRSVTPIYGYEYQTRTYVNTSYYQTQQRTSTRTVTNSTVTDYDLVLEQMVEGTLTQLETVATTNQPTSLSVTVVGDNYLVTSNGGPETITRQIANTGGRTLHGIGRGSGGTPPQSGALDNFQIVEAS